MPSSYTTSLRLTKQATGEGLNVWGDINNAGVVTLTDFAIGGWQTKALTADYALTSANGSTDEARAAMLKFTGTGSFTVTVPAASKRYDVWNACTGDLTLSNGSASVVIKAGEVVSVVTDGGAAFKLVQPTDFRGSRITSVGTPSATTDAANKAYVDAQAFAALDGDLPGQTGSAGMFLTTDGTTASWASPSVSQISDYATDQATKQAEARAFAIAAAVAL